MLRSSTSALRVGPGRARALVAALLAAALVSAPRVASAQAVTTRCSAFTANGCAALRFDVAAAADAPLALAEFDVQLAGDYTFAGGARSPFTGEDDFSGGTPFRGTARVQGGRDLFVDFLASPGFTFELGPGGAGYLEFALAGGGADLTVGYQLRDVDGAGVTGGATRVDAAPTAVVPEPATLGLVAAGALALLGATRRRALAR